MTVGWQATIAIATWISVLIQLTYATAKAAALSCDANVDRTAKAATKICIVSFQNDVISIYATAKAATVMEEQSYLFIDISIYATAKAATGKSLTYYITDLISIYATAKAATVKNGIVIAYRTDFNLRYREGSDVKPGKTRFIWKEFQSTLPRRQRHRLLILFYVHSNISIYATAKAATHPWFHFRCILRISIYATAKAATLPELKKKRK